MQTKNYKRNTSTNLKWKKNMLAKF
uniref:Uncharacterized protein n=1 Tax=Rhizophora mucronata TaxID=61149 RepID=A0A2P2P839_RHIMU